MYLPIMLFGGSVVEPGPGVKGRLKTQSAIDKETKRQKAVKGGVSGTKVKHGGKWHAVPKGKTAKQVTKHLKKEKQLKAGNKKIKAGTHTRTKGGVRKVKGK